MPFVSSTSGSLSAGRRATSFLEYNNGPICNVSGAGSDFFKREVTTNGVRIMGAGGVGGQVAVPDAWLEKVARMFELFMDRKGTGINQTYQRRMVKTLRGDTGTYHAGFPTIQRVARGAGADYSTNFLTDAGAEFWNLTDLYDTHVQNDMVWYLNSTGDGYGDGDTDAQEVIEHVFHTIHMHGLPAEDIKLYPYISSDWNTGPLYNAMVEAYDAGKWDPSGYQPPGSPDEWKTNGDAFEVAAKEYLFLLNFCMFEYTSLWEGGSLDPEWTDDMRTQAGIQTNNPLGYAFFNTWMAPIISKPSLTTIRSIFGDGNTPAQDDPSLSGSSGYVSVGVCPPVSYTAPSYTTSGIQMYYNPEDPDSYIGSGSTLYDLSGNDYDATLVNSPTHSTNSFTYAGSSSQYIASPNMVSSFNSTTAFTVEVWYAPNYTVQGEGSTVLQESGVATPSTNWYYSLIEHRKAPFGSLSFDYAGIWTGSLTAVNPVATFANNVWRNQILTYDGTSGRIYTNGSLARTVTLSRNTPWNDPNNYGYYLLLGAASLTQQSGAGNNYFTGKIGIVRAYNRALSDSEVSANYNGAKSIYGL